MAECVVWVAGTPIPQGSKSGFVVAGHVNIVEGRGAGTKRHKDWRALVADTARTWKLANDHRPYGGPVAVDLTFWLPPPKALPRWRWLPWVKPDLDKLVRSILDGISGQIITTDSRVCDLTCRKRYALDGASPGVRISVSPMRERDVGPDIHSQLAAIPYQPRIPSANG